MRITQVNNFQAFRTSAGCVSKVVSECGSDGGSGDDDNDDSNCGGGDHLTTSDRYKPF